MKNRGVFFFVGFYLLVACLSLLVMDSSVITTLESVRAISLSSHASQNLESIDSEIALLITQVDRIDDEVEQLANRSYPTHEDVKRLRASHRLKLIQMERVSGVELSRADLLRYDLVLTGTMGAVVRFLKELEGDFVVHSDEYRLQAGNDEGSQIKLSLSLEVFDQ